MRRDLGQIIVASAILEDTIGWVIIAVAFGLASAGTVDLWSVGRAVIGTALFMVASFTVGRRVVFSLIRWANDNFQSEFPVITAIFGRHVRDGADDAIDRRQHRARRFRRRHPDRRIADPDAAYRRTAPRSHRCAVHAGLLRAVRAARRPHDFAQSRSRAARRRSHRHRQRRKILRRLHRRQAWRPDARGIAGARLRHERARIDRSHRRLDRPVHGRAQSESVHAHRHHGGRHHHGDADDAALGAQPAAAAQEGAGAARARRARRQGLCDQSRTAAACRRRQRQRQTRGAADRRDRRLRRQADHDP